MQGQGRPGHGGQLTLAQGPPHEHPAADHEIARFVAAGYQPAQVVEVLVGVMLKTLSNYTNHLAITPLDGVFEARAWTPPPA
ncbi:MAG: hypothetical protein ABL886_10095 [Rhodoglobus sp.]